MTGDASEELEATRRELAAVRAALEHTITSHKAFTYSVSHDLRAPLRAIAGFATMLQEAASTELPDDARHFLSIIQENVHLLSAQMDGLLTLSRVEHRELRPTRVDMNAVVGAIVGQVQGLEPARRVSARIDALAPVTADPELLKMAMLELVKNAWKFTRQRPDASITIDSETHECVTTYRIHDDGVGFPPGLAARLFTPFGRLHGPAEYEGLGIGLAVVRIVATRHQGNVSAESRPGAGASFAFSLPN